MENSLVVLFLLLYGHTCFNKIKKTADESLDFTIVDD